MARNKKNYMNVSRWYKFWYPRQAAALEAENEKNASSFEYNSKQDALEAETSIKLTELQNQQTRFWAVAVLASIVVVILIIVFTKK